MWYHVVVEHEEWTDHHRVRLPIEAVRGVEFLTDLLGDIQVFPCMGYCGKSDAEFDVRWCRDGVPKPPPEEPHAEDCECRRCASPMSAFLRVYAPMLKDSIFSPLSPLSDKKVTLFVNAGMPHPRHPAGQH